MNNCSFSGAMTALPVSACSPFQIRLWQTAQKLESAFIAEMLGKTGLGNGASDSGQGAGQFQSFLNEAYADRLVARGGIGLARTIFETLSERGHNG